MLTKKHFKMIARLLAEEFSIGSFSEDTQDKIITIFCRMFAMTNPRFDEDRFRQEVQKHIQVEKT